MITSIYFNKLNSYEDFGLVITNMDDIPIANEITEITNGYTIRTGEYEPIEIRVVLMRRYLKSIIKYHDDIVSWLKDIKDNKLAFSFMKNRYYIVKKVEVENIPRRLGKHNTISVNFILEPFKYEVSNIITLTKNSKIYYNGTAPGKCNLKIYGNGNIQLTVNNDTVQINNVNEYVELDSKLLLCLNKDNTSKSRDMIGGFPILTKGTNEISWIGNITKIEIDQRIAYL